MSSRRWSLLACAGALLACAVLLCGTAGAATRHSPTLAPNNTVIDGPDPAILSLSGMAIARDGSGALVYLKTAGGAAHVFVSLLRNGSFQAPQQVDTGLATPSSQPVVAVTNNGVTQVAFINAGSLYVVGTADPNSPFTAPAALATGASNPSLSMSTFGKAYLAYTAIGSGGHDIRYAAFGPSGWAVSPSALDAQPADDAGTGTARPQVVCAGDGTGIVVWGEGGHIYERRVLGTSPSTTVLQADVGSVSGWNEVSADLPVVGAGGDSSYAAIAFHEVLASGASRQSRVLVNRLHAGRLDGVSAADPLTTPGPEGATNPALAVTEYGYGLIAAAGDSSHNLFATALGPYEQPGGVSQVNTIAQASSPDAVPAVAGTVSTLIAWQQDAGSGAQPEIRMRYAPDGVDLNPEQVVSTPDLGPTAAAQGLAAGGDVSGDAAVAWVQGSGASTRIVVAQLFQAPRGFAPATASAYATTPAPQFSWSPSSEQWGPVNYIVKVDGNVAGGTQATALVPAVPLTQGRHIWQASATNAAGLTVLARPAAVFVDSLPPRVTLKITGPRTPGSTLAVTATATDAPKGLPSADGSGVATLTLNWGDRSQTVTAGHRLVHVYTRKGRYRLTIRAADRAGNRIVVTKTIVIRSKSRRQRSKPNPRRHGPLARRAAHRPTQAVL